MRERKLQRALLDFHRAAVTRLPDGTPRCIAFAVPNGELARNLLALLTGGANADDLPERDALMPAGQGVLPGASDLVWLLERGRSVLVEVKTEELAANAGMRFDPPAPGTRPAKRVVLSRAGSQSRAQKRFQRGAEALGHHYRVVRSIEEYADLLEEFGVPLRCRPGGAGIRFRAPVGFKPPGDPPAS